MSTKLSLAELVARAQARKAPRVAQAPLGHKPLREDHGQALREDHPLPLAEAIAQGLAEATAPSQGELEAQRAEVQRAEKPRAKPGPDPRKPWPVAYEAKPIGPDKVQERIALNNALAKAKLGQRLTLRDRKVLGKWNLARIMAKFRPKGGDCG